MFAGIVEAVGEVKSRSQNSAGLQLGLSSRLFTDSPDLAPHIGDSICVSGVCLTVVRLKEGTAYFDLASETRRVTTLDSVQVGSRVNLERSLRVGDRIHGHFVTGHVDAVAKVIRREEESGNTVRFEIALPPSLRSFVAPKGAITVNGTSLTVGNVSADAFTVYIVPHTLAETTFGALAVGDSVNLEVDVLARYVVRALGESCGNGK